MQNLVESNGARSNPQTPPVAGNEKDAVVPLASAPEKPTGILGAIAVQREYRLRQELAPYAYKLDHPQSGPVPAQHDPVAVVPQRNIDPGDRKSLPLPERKTMQPNKIFSQFWRRPQPEDAPAKTSSMEASVTTRSSSAPENENDVRRELLSYEDIYHAAGIMSSRTAYGIHKVVEMLQSERIRDLSKEVKRASVLMALDVAGTGVGELLEDATRRQEALNAYEAAQRKHLDDFEAIKTLENAQLNAELDRLRAHYAERAQQNLDQVAREREALRNWQMAVQHESQRIADVMELCGKPAPVKGSTSTLNPAADEGNADNPGRHRAASAS